MFEKQQILSQNVGNPIKNCPVQGWNSQTRMSQDEETAKAEKAFHDFYTACKNLDEVHRNTVICFCVYTLLGNLNSQQ